jgi:type IV pilus assembly protein PilV
MSFSSRTRLRGYSLVEVLIGMVVLMIAIMSAYMLIFNTTKVLAHNHRVTVASSLAEYKLEELRNTPYAEILSSEEDEVIDSQNGEGGPYTRSWVVADDTPIENLKTVTVTVSWPEWEQTAVYNLAGVIGE